MGSSSNARAGNWRHAFWRVALLQARVHRIATPFSAIPPLCHSSLQAIPSHTHIPITRTPSTSPRPRLDSPINVDIEQCGIVGVRYTSTRLPTTWMSSRLTTRSCSSDTGCSGSVTLRRRSGVSPSGASELSEAKRGSRRGQAECGGSEASRGVVCSGVEVADRSAGGEWKSAVKLSPRGL